MAMSVSVYVYINMKSYSTRHLPEKAEQLPSDHSNVMSAK